jgi:hypothetical protein
VKKTKWKLTWLSADECAELVQLKLMDFDYLITKKKVSMCVWMGWMRQFSQFIESFHYLVACD